MGFFSIVSIIQPCGLAFFSTSKKNIFSPEKIPQCLSASVVLDVTVKRISGNFAYQWAAQVRSDCYWSFLCFVLFFFHLEVMMCRTEKSNFVLQLAARECWESWHFLPHGALRHSKKLHAVYRESNFCKNTESVWEKFDGKYVNVRGGESHRPYFSKERKETETESDRTKGKMGKEMKGRDGKLCNNPRSLLNHNHSAVSARRGRVWTGRPRCHLLPIKSYKKP